jgi:tRNA (guanine6-N2)-methyltransferase
MRRVFALTTRGLESVSAEEIAALNGVTVDKVTYRRVVAICAGPMAPLLELCTVDDVFFDVATWPGIGRPRSALATLNAECARLDLRRAAAACAEIRSIGEPPAFSITANFVGRRNYTTQEIKQVCAEGIATGHNWPYAPDDSVADLNVRIFIEHATAFVGVRLAKRPLHRRSYKQSHVPGSLKPPVAAALLSLAEVGPGMRVLDPCCGGGTILIEAATRGAVSHGGDNDPVTTAAAQTNIDAARAAACVQLWDAQALPVPDASFERVVSNLPWGRQAGVDASLASFYQRVCAEIRRVLAPGGRVSLLTNAPHLVDFRDLDRTEQIEISLFGQTPTITLWRIQNERDGGDER